MRPKFSIIIPIKEINDFLRKETLPAILRQTRQDFEIIVLPDKPTKEKLEKTRITAFGEIPQKARIIPSWPKLGPADKRDLGAKEAKGEILVFLDDDSYPETEWLENACKIFEAEKRTKVRHYKPIAGVCGPSLTPPQNNLRQKASGYVWSSWLGSGGAGAYRCAKSSRREVDDFPTVNLMIKKKDFWDVGGFDSGFWPGEDTKLCRDIVYKLGKKIIYDPEVIVYHHRREIFKSHLQQIARYALHRGHFARSLPETSLRLGYLLPTMFVASLILAPVLFFMFWFLDAKSWAFLVLVLYVLMIVVYKVALLWTGARVFLQEKNARLLRSSEIFRLVLLSMSAIFLTHVVYGILFVKGFLTPNLKSVYRRK